jgi:hypothetical protein
LKEAEGVDNPQRGERGMRREERGNVNRRGKGDQFISLESQGRKLPLSERSDGRSQNSLSSPIALGSILNS